MRRLGMVGAAQAALATQWAARDGIFTAPPGTHTLIVETGQGGGGGGAEAMEPVAIRNKRGQPPPPRRELPAFCRDPRNLRIYKPNGQRERERRMRQAVRAAGLVP